MQTIRTVNNKSENILLKVVVIVYNRFENLKHWCYCWKVCDQMGAELVVIHNSDFEDTKYEAVVLEAGGVYIRRKNIGFDIGALQDVFRGRLEGFPKWDRLFWATDDTFPMTTDFLRKFSSWMVRGVGVVCTKISEEVRLHIRTTGFMIDSTTASRIGFPADPIITKSHCYDFEHRATKGIFLQQVRGMGLLVKQVAADEISPVFDAGFWKKLKREQEHKLVFKKPIPPQTQLKVHQRFVHKPQTKSGSVTFICPIYNSFPAIISSLLMQTNKDWILWLIHDGQPENDKIKEYVNFINDPRIVYKQTAFRNNNWGHQIRADFLQQVQTEFVVITNPDNQLVPSFIEYMKAGFMIGTVGTWCSHMVHSYRKWDTQECRLERGWIDCSGMMLRTAEAKAVGWKSLEHSADWFFFENLIKVYGINRFAKVKGTLLIHN